MITSLLLAFLAPPVFACSVSYDYSPKTTAEQDFASVNAQEARCGVESANLPYVLHAKGEAKGTIVLIHGLTGNPATMRDIANDLQKSGYNVVAPILHGHGGPQNLLNDASYESWLEAVHMAGLEAAKLKQPLYIMGHSTGGVMAGLEAANHPGMYNALIGLDPALNMNGRDGAALKHACTAGYFYNYVGEMTSGWLWPYLNRRAIDSINEQNEIEHPNASRIPHSSCVLGHGTYVPELQRRFADMDLRNLLRPSCGDDFKIPSYDYDFTMNSLCALSKATADMTGSRLRKLPPSLVILSKDQKIFGFISKDQIKAAVAADPRHKLVQSDSPVHALMGANCMAGYKENLAATESWLAAH